MTAEHRKWVETWDRVKARPEDELRTWAWRKVENGIDIGRRLRNQNECWTTIAAEIGQRKEDLSPLARRIGDHVCKCLKEAGYSFHYEWDQTDGVAYAGVKVKPLWPRKSSSASPTSLST